MLAGLSISVSLSILSSVTFCKEFDLGKEEDKIGSEDDLLSVVWFPNFKYLGNPLVVSSFIRTLSLILIHAPIVLLTWEMLVGMSFLIECFFLVL